MGSLLLGVAFPWCSPLLWLLPAVTCDSLLKWAGLKFQLPGGDCLQEWPRATDRTWWISTTPLLLPVGRLAACSVRLAEPSSVLFIRAFSVPCLTSRFPSELPALTPGLRIGLWRGSEVRYRGMCSEGQLLPPSAWRALPAIVHVPFREGLVDLGTEALSSAEGF